MRASFMPSDRCAMLMPLVRASALQSCAIAAGWRISGLGGVAEWSKALVLKTSEPRGSVGSNPTPTADQSREALALSRLRSAGLAPRVFEVRPCWARR